MSFGMPRASLESPENSRKTKLADWCVGASVGSNSMRNIPPTIIQAVAKRTRWRTPAVDTDDSAPAASRQTAHTQSSRH